MTKPNKKRGFRQIVVENHKFNWRFNGKIDVRTEIHKENRLIVDFGWFDELLYINDRKNRPPEFEPKTVTPEFVKQAIEFALKNKWDVNSKVINFAIKYSEGKFRVVKNAL